MNKLKTVLLIISILIGMQSIHSQTVDEIAANHIEAMGGADKLLSLNTVRMQYSLNVQGVDVGVTLTISHLIGMRADISVIGTANYQIVTQEKGILFMPMQGMSETMDMPDEQLKAGQIQLDVQDVLLNYKEKGTGVELIGKEKVNGEDNYRLRLTFKNGIVTDYFISSNNYMFTKTSGKRNVNGYQMDIETSYSNYKQNADGYWFAYTTSRMQDETNYDKIETNIDVDPGIYK